LKFKNCQTRKELLGTRLEDCDDVDTYALRIEQKVKDYNLCSQASWSDWTRTLGMMTDLEQVLFNLRQIPKNDDWQFFLQLMMDKNAMATLTHDEIVIKLLENEAMMKSEQGLRQQAILFRKGNTKGIAKGNGRDRKSSRSDESDKDQGDRKSQPTCFYYHKEGHQDWNSPNMKQSDPPVTKQCTEAAANTMDDTTTPRDSAEITT
jgi:hypothetical protein